MTRIVKKPEVRKGEILSAAQKFFFRKGYDQTTIQDIIDDLDIAKGTFYHYFRSKTDLLDELVERMTTEMAASLEPIVESDRNAVEKFNEFIAAACSFKAVRKDLLLVLLRVLFRDENTIIRVKMYARMMKKNARLISSIIRQGVQEGSFNTPYPDDVGEMILRTGRDLNEAISRLMLKENQTPEQLLGTVKEKTSQYQHVIARVLGAPEGSVKVSITDDFEDVVRFLSEKVRGGKAEGTVQTNRPQHA